MQAACVLLPVVSSHDLITGTAAWLQLLCSVGAAVFFCVIDSSWQYPLHAE